MNSESRRIADQLRRAFTGVPWHGSPLSELLAGVTEEQASARPLPSLHNIWELVLHIFVYVYAAVEATQGVAMPKFDGTGTDWSVAPEGDAAAWTGATNQLFDKVEQLARAIEGFTDVRLLDTVPGRGYDFYYLFHGIVQHSLYHGGQIAILKKVVSGS